MVVGLEAGLIGTVEKGCGQFWEAVVEARDRAEEIFSEAEEGYIGHRGVVEAVEPPIPIPIRPLEDDSDIDGEIGVVVDLRSSEPTISIEHRTLRRLQPVPITLPEDSGALAAGRLSKAVKRTIDIAASLLGILALAPVMLAAAMAVKVTSPGPVLYVSERVGRGREVFTFLKFRTMRVGSDEILDALRDQNEVTGPVFKMKSDPRITSVGRWMRRLSIDELPQLFLVLSGTMSLVGPRPPTPEEVDQYTEYQMQRLLVKPGLTCIWQVSGRSDVGFEDWVDMDLEYIRNWSPWLDTKLLVQTVPAVLSGRGAY